MSSSGRAGRTRGVEIGRLSSMPATDLRDLWQKLFRRSPPAGLSGDLLVRSLAFRIEAERHGDLSPILRRRLQQAAQEAAMKEENGPVLHRAPGGPSSLSRVMQPGSRIVREWRGRMHEVIVVPEGFLWNGEVHGSLSTIARRITGTSWNGWVFFGVDRPGPRHRRKNAPSAPRAQDQAGERRP